MSSILPRLQIHVTPEEERFLINPVEEIAAERHETRSEILRVALSEQLQTLGYKPEDYMPK